MTYKSTFNLSITLVFFILFLIVIYFEIQMHVKLQVNFLYLEFIPALQMIVLLNGHFLGCCL